ncbi:MAG: hypothetical protein KDA68_00185 [Planctomycetaceae bacterium]|nr:hypothetical protein [Planctomycetaceae bacterium]
MYRAVLVPAGKHTVVWEYEPSIVWIGANISLATIVFLATIAHLRFWHPNLFKRKQP